ncbi:unnamed protein product [Strongylus vulgaris]|uniref:Uncharacterized protein n=1 Tax=Strongylus vulgaris TaxID=40348 RepID=A0A3P7I270_STRVU|nr:unnamed protein product [Strongylus vulgaris]
MIVDEQYGACPEPAPDCFSNPDYNPVYSEDSHLHGADRALVGSAENYDFNKGEEVKMVSVRPEDIPKSHEESEPTPNFLRKFSLALAPTIRSRSNSENRHDDVERDGIERVQKYNLPNLSLEAVTEESNYSTVSTVVVSSDKEDDITLDQNGAKSESKALADKDKYNGKDL